ncbi:UNKNOWN [Stylonychia lemnae]|uniref:Uncharacterized protein n=1 Tax=Stylonychia lemnae TaxID=5949 RepID=A0A078A6X5_STYLE|nr:UNKNOWN [Stylonychia lemnae]|eukprot:CDW77631.1 UNKNOWN [Stylonychia lemnae]
MRSQDIYTDSQSKNLLVVDQNNYQEDIQSEKSNVESVAEDDEVSCLNESQCQSQSSSDTSSIIFNDPYQSNLDQNRKSQNHYQLGEITQNLSYLDQYCIQEEEEDYQQHTIIENNTTDSTIGGYYCAADGLFYENPNTDFQNWDFHPNDPEEPSQFNYSASIESLRITLNTYMKKQLKTPFQANFKKAVVQVNKLNNVDGDVTYFDDFLRNDILDDNSKDKPQLEIDFHQVLNTQCSKFLGRKYITKKHNTWLNQARLEQFHKTRDFRKLCRIYFHIDHSQTLMNEGVYPCFVVTNKLVIPPKSKTNNNQNENVQTSRKLLNKLYKKKLKK